MNRADLIREFIETNTRQVSLSWISNDALYFVFTQIQKYETLDDVIPHQAFSRFLGHDLGLKNVRRWVGGRQIYGRRLWPLEEIREKLNFGIDFI